MIDSNISMEEDTELRDLVVQTLENNGVLAKVRAELRASVFLALEEQESVMNPEPLLNKTVKQYLANSEGKLLFSLVREFLEYFGLDYTISVYDPETYSGKEYNYVGRNKLCEELGINSSEPLLGEILKNSMNSICNVTQRTEVSETDTSRHNKTNETSTNCANATFEVPVPKILHTANEEDCQEKVENSTEQSSAQCVPINVTITDKVEAQPYEKAEPRNSLRGEVNEQKNPIHENNALSEKSINSVEEIEVKVVPPDKEKLLDRSADSNIQQENQHANVTKQNSINNKEFHIANNVQNKKQVSIEHNFGRGVYFEDIIGDEKKDNVDSVQKAESPPLLDRKSGSIFGDLPPLNGRKTNINDLKELIDARLDNMENYEEDFVSSASGSLNEQSPSKELQDLESPLKLQAKKEDNVQSACSEDISEEIEETDDILSSTSCLDGVNMEEKVANFTAGITTNCSNEI